MSMKLLFLDTCSVVKIFVPEKGHDVMWWLLSSDAVLLYSVHLVTSTHVRDEFPKTIATMVRDGRLPATHEKGILMRSEGYLNNLVSGLRCVDITKPPPHFHSGTNTSADILIAKHARKERDRVDLSQLSIVINYLRCFTGGSLPHVVTSDKKFKSTIRKEGFGVIDPEKFSIAGIKQYLGGLT
jgi:hypothetical protein